MKRSVSPEPFAFAAALGLGLFLAGRRNGGATASDLAFALGSGALIVGLIRALGNLKMFASLRWGTRLLKRIFLGRSRPGRVEAEDYAAYRAKQGNHPDAPWLLAAAAALMVASFALAKLQI